MNLNQDENKKELLQGLRKIENLQVDEKVPLKDYTSFKVGGPAAIMVSPATKEALQRILQKTSQFNIDVLVLGRGSNIIVSDSGFSGLVIYMGRLNKIEVKEEKLFAEAGASLANTAAVALEHSLTGLEFASGIPGTVGGAVFMNAGAYGGEIKDIIESADLFNNKGQFFYLPEKKLELSYRTSILQKKKMILYRIKLNLKKGKKEKIKKLTKELNRKRKEKQPLNMPSAGSMFKRPPDNYAGKLIEEAGMKGVQIGGARVSKKHAGFIVNCGQASARDIKELIEEVQACVFQKSGIQLEPEPRFIGDFD